MYNFNIEEARHKLLNALDENHPYTMDEFNAEYGEEFTVSSDADIAKIPFNFVNESNNPDPEYATDGASAFDLRANLIDGELLNHREVKGGAIVLKRGEFMMIPTGLFFDIPEGWEIQVRPRSGLSAKFGITVLNTPGTVDSDYTGEIKVVLINHSNAYYNINHGDRIAQAVCATVTAKRVIGLNRVESISKDTERGSGGFGSTGKN